MRARPATSGDVPPIDLIVSSSRFQICKNFHFWIFRKSPKLDRMPDLNKTLKKISPVPYVLNSNPWLALIPTVGYNSINIDYHVRTQSIIIIERI